MIDALQVCAESCFDNDRKRRIHGERGLCDDIAPFLPAHKEKGQ